MSANDCDNPQPGVLIALLLSSNLTVSGPVGWLSLAGRRGGGSMRTAA